MSDADVKTVTKTLVADEKCRDQLTAYQAYLPAVDAKSGKRKGRIHGGDVCAMLKKVKSHIGLQHWLEVLFTSAVHGRTGKYSECWVGDSELIERVVDVITSVCEIPLPSFDLEVFGNARLTGLWDIEYGELYFKFSVNECFTRILTPAERSLATRRNQDLEVSEWVTISY